MIIWLASYPKSGNTWIRLFLDSLFLTSDQFNINQNYIQQFPLRKHFDGIAENINDQSEFAKKCIHEAGVAIVPGTSFGKTCKDYARFSFAASKENISNAIEKIEKMLR